MASACHPFYTLVLLLTICHHGLGSTVKIDVTRQYENEVHLHAFNIRCSLEPHGNCAKTINLLKVTKGADDKTIAGIQSDDYIFYNRLRRSSIRAEGHIDKVHHNRTFFSATVSSPVKEDSGLYNCFVQYVDEYGSLKEEAASHNVTFQVQDLQDVVRHLLVDVSFLKNLMEFQKNEADQTISRLQQEVSDLNRAGRDRSQKIQELVDKDSFSSAFSVYRPNKVINNADTIVFKKSILNIGNHYSTSTGIFTAPRKGLYVFHLFLTMGSGDDFYAHLKVNDVIMTSLFAHDHDTLDQSSVSTVLSLESGDKVWPFVSTGGNIRWVEHRFTVFNGYLLKLL